MLIIFAIAALALLLVVGIVVILPAMIVASVIQSRRRLPADSLQQAAQPDSDFVELVVREWPSEAAVLTAINTPHD
jgi:hypothetical protein